MGGYQGVGDGPARDPLVGGDSCRDALADLVAVVPPGPAADPIGMCGGTDGAHVVVCQCVSLCRFLPWPIAIGHGVL